MSGVYKAAADVPGPLGMVLELCLTSVYIPCPCYVDLWWPSWYDGPFHPIRMYVFIYQPYLTHILI